MELRMDDLNKHNNLPKRYTRDGENISPRVHWSGVPKGTRELALVFENRTPHTREPFVQWLVYRIPPDINGLQAGLRHKAAPEAAELAQGTNSQGNIGYDGPVGTVSKRYDLAFHLYALDAPLNLKPGADKKALLQAAEGHILAEAEQAVNYERSPAP